LTEAWSVDVGGLSFAISVNAASTGSTMFTVHGAGFGIVLVTGRARFGLTACERTIWASDTFVMGRAAQGLAGTRRVTWTAGVRSSSVTEVWSSDLGGVSVTRGINRAVTGSKSLTVHGAGMGVAGFSTGLRLHKTACETTGWSSDTAVRCRTGHGVGGSRRVVMTVSGQEGSRTQAWSMDVGGLSVVSGRNVFSTGSKLLSVHGTGLGIGAYTATSRVGQSRCEVTNWQSETSVRCRVAQGIQKSRRAVQTVGVRGGSLTQLISVDLAGLSALRRRNGPGTGSASVTVHGAGMGTLRYTTKARDGHTNCESTDWQSETSVR
jgi:hypothetical protein